MLRRSGIAVCLACGAVTLVLANSSGIGQVISGIAVVGIAALPASMAVAILRYRLYEIDRIISRTLAYAIVTGLLIGLYTGLVLLAAAALFNPIRRRVQLRVDRRFNRARYDADQMVAGFAARLKDTVDLDSVRDDLASVVYQALEPAHVSVWISHRD